MTLLLTVLPQVSLGYLCSSLIVASTHIDVLIAILFFKDRVCIFSCYIKTYFFVLKVDLDLGNYERFLDIKLTRDHNITIGKIYQVYCILPLFVVMSTNLSEYEKSCELTIHRILAVFNSLS